MQQQQQQQHPVNGPMMQSPDHHAGYHHPGHDDHDDVALRACSAVDWIGLDASGSEQHRRHMLQQQVCGCACVRAGNLYCTRPAIPDLAFASVYI